MKKRLAWFVVVVTLAFVISPAFTAPFSGFTADQLPIPQINPPSQPAGYAFAIWGLIYVWLIASAVYGVWKRPVDPDWTRARWPLAVSLAFGVPWLAIANASPFWATLVIFVMAGAAIYALNLTPSKDVWWLRVPVSIYAGWLSAASFVSLAALTAGYGIVFGSFGWAILATLLAIALAIVVQIMNASAKGYGLTVIWALLGIIVANLDTSLVVALVAAFGITAIGLVLILTSDQDHPLT